LWRRQWKLPVAWPTQEDGHFSGVGKHQSGQQELEHRVHEDWSGQGHTFPEDDVQHFLLKNLSRSTQNAAFSVWNLKKKEGKKV
jgi:hypothetical protein